MLRKKWFLLSLVVLLTFACQFVTASVNAQQTQGNSNTTPAAGKNAVSDPLAIYKQTGINSKQEESITALIQSFEELMLNKGKIMMDLMREMRALSLNADLDEQAAIAKQEQINQLNAQMAVERVRLLAKIRGILTPEQRKKLVTLL